MPIHSDTIRGETYIPRDIERGMREKLRESNPDIADAPLAALLRYAAARIAVGPEQASKYIFNAQQRNRLKA